MNERKKELVRASIWRRRRTQPFWIYECVHNKYVNITSHIGQRRKEDMHIRYIQEA